MGVVGQRRDLFKMKNMVTKQNTIGSLPKQPSTLTSVARMFDQVTWNKHANYQEPLSSQVRN